MHDPKIVEAMARAIGARLVLRGSVNDAATDALRDLCTLRPDVAAVLRGEAVAVPREATDAMALAALDRSPEPHQPASPVWQLYADIYRAMTAASPYAQETPDAR